jgi:hypothetical protein
MPRRLNFPGIEKTSYGYHLRITGINPRTGKMQEKTATMVGATREEALAKANELYELIKTGGRRRAKQQTLTDFARSWLARKAPHLRSDLTKARYIEALESHVLPVLGDIYITAITKIDIETWMAKKAATEYAPGKKYSHETINGWWRVFKELLQSAVADLDLPRDPTMKVAPLPVDSRKGKNALTSEELSLFMPIALRDWPQWYALMFLGFSIGARPGELRPLRWGVDLNLETGHLILQRSQRGKYLGPTKTREPREMDLADEAIRVMRWHHKRLIDTNHPGLASGLVFPSLGRARKPPPIKVEAAAHGSPEEDRRAYFRDYRRLERARKRAETAAKAGNFFISPSALDKPFADIAKKANISGTVTPKAMRRTFNDLARKAKVHDLVLRSLTGHRTTEMQAHYSTIGGDEKRAGMAKVIELFGGSSLVPPAIEQDQGPAPKSVMGKRPR